MKSAKIKKILLILCIKTALSINLAIPPTTPFALSSTTTPSNLTIPFESNPPKKEQILVYTYYNWESIAPIHLYKITETGRTETVQKLNSIERPYAASLPHLVFNKNLKKLEIIGDYSDDSNSNHFQVSIVEFDTFGQGSVPTRFEDSLYRPDYSSTLVYSSIGTISIGGTRLKGGVFIVTKHSNWPFFDKSENNLDKIEYKFSAHRIGAISIDDTVFIAGGIGMNGASDKIRKISFAGVSNLEEAKNKRWVEIGRLKTSVSRTSIQMFGSKLLVEGHGDFENQPELQIYDFGESGISCESVKINSSSRWGLHKPVSYTTENRVILLGGEYSEKDCRKQVVELNPIGSKSYCYDDENIEFEGIIFEKPHGYQFMNIHL